MLIIKAYRLWLFLSPLVIMVRFWNEQSIKLAGHYWVIRCTVKAQLEISNALKLMKTTAKKGTQNNG